MILQNRNHPSIILWGVCINESVDDDVFYNRTNKIAHQLDPSRAPVWLVCNIKINVSAYCVITAGVYTRFSSLHSGYK